MPYAAADENSNGREIPAGRDRSRPSQDAIRMLSCGLRACDAWHGEGRQRSSLNTTCWRIFGSYFLSSIRSRLFVLFFLVTYV